MMKRVLVRTRTGNANLVMNPGIATQLAAEAQSPGIQEVHSVSYRHQRRPPSKPVLVDTRR